MFQMAKPIKYNEENMKSKNYTILPSDVVNENNGHLNRFRYTTEISALVVSNYTVHLNT